MESLKDINLTDIKDTNDKYKGHKNYKKPLSSRQSR